MGAAVAAIQGLERGRWCFIAGGRDKGGDYGPLRREVEDRGAGVWCSSARRPISIEAALAGAAPS